MMLRTPLVESLGLVAPIFGSPMEFVAGPALVAAVSNAGGLGILSSSAQSQEVLRREIARVRSLTSKPFGVSVPLDGRHLPFAVDTIIDVCIEGRVPVMATAWGDVSAHVPGIHAAGLKVIHQVSSVAEARVAVQARVDAIVAQGMEAGGHVGGAVTTMALVPRVVDVAERIPVVAAGGIADARGFLAALTLGAQAVMTGISEIKPAAAVIREFTDEARQILIEILTCAIRSEFKS